jgi:hypothetical protein
MLCTFFVNVTLLGACDASELDGLSIDSVASGRGWVQFDLRGAVC